MGGVNVSALDDFQVRAASITMFVACTLPEPVVVTVTLPDLSMLARLETLSTALVFVGLQTPPEQFTFLVAPEDMLRLALAGPISSAADTSCLARKRQPDCALSSLSTS